MRKKLLKSLAKLAVSFLLFISFVAQSTPEKVLVDSGNPPFMYGDSKEAKGLYAELIKAVFKKMQVEGRIDAMPWKRAIAEINMAIAGVAGLYKTAERLQKYDYSDPLFEEKLILFVKAKEKFSYNSIVDLNNKTIGVIRGWSYGDEFDRAKAAGKFIVIESKNDLSNFYKLNLNIVNVVIAIEQSADAAISKMNNKEGFSKLPIPLLVNKTYLAFSKNANKTEFLKKFNEALQSLKEEGEYDKIVANILSSE